MSPFHVYDSFTGEEFPKHSMAAVSYSPLWQLVRLRCHFKTLDATRVAVATLDVYIGLSASKEERQYRAWRAANLLRAVPLATPSSIGIHYVDREVGSYMPTQTERLFKLTQEVGLPTYWDWAVTRREVLSLWQKTPELFMHCIKQKRGLVARRAHQGPKNELRYYLTICQDIMDEYIPLALFKETYDQNAE